MCLVAPYRSTPEPGSTKVSRGGLVGPFPDLISRGRGFEAAPVRAPAPFGRIGELLRAKRPRRDDLVRSDTI